MSEAKRTQNRIEEIRELIAGEVGSSTMDLINELVEYEIELERLCNQ